MCTRKFILLMGGKRVPDVEYLRRYLPRFLDKMNIQSHKQWNEAVHRTLASLPPSRRPWFTEIPNPCLFLVSSRTEDAHEPYPMLMLSPSIRVSYEYYSIRFAGRDATPTLRVDDSHLLQPRETDDAAHYNSYPFIPREANIIDAHDTSVNLDLHPTFAHQCWEIRDVKAEEQAARNALDAALDDFLIPDLIGIVSAYQFGRPSDNLDEFCQLVLQAPHMPDED